MRLWHLKAKVWPGYGRTESAIVRAETEDDARAIVEERDYEKWSADYATCEELPVDGPAGLILEDNTGG